MSFFEDAVEVAEIAKTGIECDCEDFVVRILQQLIGVLRFASEFIRCEDEYNMDGYTNYWQNLNAIAWAKSVLERM